MPTDWNNTQDVMLKRQKAINAGYKAADVDAFIKQQKDNAAMMELAKKGVVKPADLASKDPQLALKIAQQSTTPNTPTGADAVAEAMRQGGSQFIQQGKDVAARNAIAETILKLGGVNKYRQQLPLNDLLNPAEKTSETAATDLQREIDYSLPAFQKDELGGTGPVAQYIPGFLRTPAGREKVADVGKVQALYQQMISGKVVSDREVERLSQFLPTKGKTETQNREDFLRLKKGIEDNLTLFEKAKREGLTPNEAYQKYGSSVIRSDGTPKKQSSGGSKYKIEAVQ